jgi:hypothetical protein
MKRQRSIKKVSIGILFYIIKNERVIIVLSGIVLLIFLFVVLNKQTENAQKFDENRLIGSFQIIGSPTTILTLRQGHLFTLENHINGKFYGDGNWEVNFEDTTRLTLDFENGESLTFMLVTKDGSFVCENVPNEKITLKRIAN